MSYSPPAASLALLGGIDFSQATDYLENWKKAFDKADKGSAKKDPSKCKALKHFPDGTLFFEAKAAVCADGWTDAANVDKTGDPETSTTLKDAVTGKQVPFDATKIPYLVLPKGSFDLESGIPIGSLGVVIYKNKCIPAIYCEHGPLEKLGEVSIRMHEMLEHNPWANEQHTKIQNVSIPEGVLYFVFPGSKITHPKLTTANVLELVKKRGEDLWTAFKARYGTGVAPAEHMAVEHVAVEHVAAEHVAVAGVAGVTAGPAAAALGTRELQEKLAAHGLYDRGAIDGEGGPFTRWALREFQKAAGITGEAEAGPRTQAALNEPVDKWFPLQPGGDLAGRIVRAMLNQGHWLCRHEECCNIIYVEGMNPDGTPNGNEANRFNDVRFLIGVTDGRPVILEAWEGSTEPGRHYTMNPMNPKGAARIAFGQYYAWSVGHHNDHPDHPALVQSRAVTVHRDLNKDFSRHGDETDTGDFGINQHWGYNYPVNDIVDASAGCLVGRLIPGHKQFMKRVTDDARYEASHGYRFTTTILPVSAVLAV